MSQFEFKPGELLDGVWRTVDWDSSDACEKLDGVTQYMPIPQPLKEQDHE